MSEMINEQEAVSVVAERALALSYNPIFQAMIVRKLRQGLSRDDVRRWVLDIAIATLYGDGGAGAAE